MSHAQWQGPTHTHPQSGRQSVLSEVSMAPAAQCDDKVEMFDREGGGVVGEIQSMMVDVAPFPHPPTPTCAHVFSSPNLYFSMRLFLWSNTRLRPQTPTPSGTTELSTNLTAWSDVSRSRITTDYEPSCSLSLCLPHPPAHLSSAPHTPLEQQSTVLCSHFHEYLFLLFPHSLTAPLQ